ncbi:MAG: tRNA guanosine(15) transglycosylase TgtA [Candidatus Asgardarchaeum californiense]|nr:MAG: tRNA guanosine(15) transglycosylase TgtA [Candidatus Asgardarchaeum californiense]
MSFEVKEHDLLGRIGVLETRRGRIETPYMFPVINPSKLIIPPKELKEKFGFNAIITNAYFIKKNFYDIAIKEGVHKLLDFSGIIMTDSGAYQLLMYGDVDITPDEVIYLQEKIGSDIAVILDEPTGSWPDFNEGKRKVDTTIARARESISLRKDETILWVAPVQGGTNLQLLSYSAREMDKLPYHIIAIGSQTPLMMNYRYKEISDIIVTVKKNVSIAKPIHLFGAGHPMVFSLMVALGCDLFDSALYALFAQDDRYITPTGTLKLENLKESICNCPVCRKFSPDELRALPKAERERYLAEHNLYVALYELHNIKQAIYEGRLWEYLNIKMRSHPRLLSAFKNFKNFTESLLTHDPVTKLRAIFYGGPEDVYRPAIVRHRKKMLSYIPSHLPKNLLLIDYYSIIYNNSVNRFIMKLINKNKSLFQKLHIVYASPLFGVIPYELSEIYPLSQHEIPDQVDYEVLKESINFILTYLKQKNYKSIIFYSDYDNPFSESLKLRLRDIFPGISITNSIDELSTYLMNLGVLNE